MTNSNKSASKHTSASVFSYVTLGIVAFLWSWIFFCSIARLVLSLITGYLIAVFAYSVIVAISTACIVLFVRTILRLKDKYKQPKWWIVAVFFFGWAAMEWLVAHLLTLVWIGHASSLDTALPFTSFTPLVAHTPLRYSARLLGYYGLSASIATVIFCVCINKYRRMLWFVAGFIIVINVSMWTIYRSANGSQVRVGAVAESVPARVKQIQQPADLVVFPEYGFDEGMRPKNRIQSNTAGTTYYIGSEEQHNPIGRQNVLIFGSTDKGVIEQRAKSRLIPGGEYLPYFTDYGLRIFGGNNTREFFMRNRAVEKGPFNLQPIVINDSLRLGSSVCASIIAPGDYQGFTKNGATLLTNSASLGIFQSGLFSFQHQGMAQFMATANARPFVQSANDADGFILNKDGNMVVRVKSTPPRVGYANVTTNLRRTPYSVLGEWPVLVGFMLLGGWGVYALSRSKAPGVSRVLRRYRTNR